MCVFIFFMAHISALHSRFFVRRSSSQKELRSGRGAIPLSFTNSGFISSFEFHVPSSKFHVPSSKFRVQSFGFQKLAISITQLLKYPNTQIPKYSNTQTPKHSITKQLIHSKKVPPNISQHPSPPYNRFRQQ